MSRVIWITGLSGAGKSVLAAEVVAALRARGLASLLLDGDAVRAALADTAVGHDHASRLANARRIAGLARLAAEQGLSVVVATMSLFPEIHDWNRAHLPDYLEVYLRVSLERLVERDARALYSRAARGEVANVVGLDLPFVPPLAPDLVLDNELPGPDLPSLTARVLDACGLGPSFEPPPPRGAARSSLLPPSEASPP